jgi:RHS repeat-associated protein
MDETAPSPKIGFTSTVDALAPAGLSHMGARDYDPSTGTFLSRDPWARPDGMSWVGTYAYTDGNPVSYWDPTGWSEKEGRGGTCWLFGFRNDSGGCVGGDLGGAVRVCPVFGCLAVGANVDRQVHVSGGPGIAVELPGASVSPSSKKECGSTERNEVFASTPVGHAGWGWDGQDAKDGYSTSEWSWDGRGVRKPSTRLGAGYVHEWEQTWC